MPSQKRAGIATALVLIGITALLYSIVVVQQLLVGTGVAVGFFIVAWFVYYGGASRRTLTRAVISVTLVYGIFTLQLPIAVIAACVVYLTAWLTGSDSPLEAPDTQVFPVESSATDESDCSE